MDVIKSVNTWLSKWSKGGEQECRDFLLLHHSNPSDSNSADVVFNVYQTLLFSTVAWWTTPNLTSESFSTFIRSVVDKLPSSSSTFPGASIFGEQLATNEKAVPTLEYKRVEADKQVIVDILAKLLAAKIVSPTTVAERLDTALLASAGLFPDKVALDKKEVRTRTGLFYKQNKFNLLREQSEGYSKLTTELTASLGPPHTSSDGRPTESLSAIENRARPVWAKIISLIGYFDLDPNRALDIILDIFSTHLTTHYTFFLALLSFSPWAGSYHRKESAAMSVDPDPASFEGKSLDEILQLCSPKSNSEGSTDNSPRILAQVLGFKFAYYCSPAASESTPRNLYLTAALLIHENFITLEDLYPHLSLDDPELDEAHKAYVADVKTRMSPSKTNALTMAAPLESGGSSVSRVKPTPAAPKPPSKGKDVPQKSGLVSALLSIGAIRPALWIMSRYPWLVDAHREIADLMIRIMKRSINSLYESLFVTKARNPSFLQPRNRYSAAGVAPCPSRKQMLTDCVPMCRSLDDLKNVIEPMLQFIKLHISRDVIFLTKFLRLGRKHLASTTPEDKSPPDRADPIRVFWLNIMRSSVLPGLSLLWGNAVINVEVWNIIKQYSMEERWSLYGEWKSHSYQAHTELKVRRAETERRAVAKLAHSNPCIFFPNVVNQVMAYDNFASVVIHGLHYVTVMGFDVLVYVIVDTLSNTFRSRVKDDGVNTMDWLQSLASFSGMLFRRYSADLTPILSYIAHQLQNKMTTEIVVLRELMSIMAGIKPLHDLADRDISAMAGGPALRIEVLASETRGSKADPHDNNMRGPMRFGKALIDTKLARPILIQVAQQRQSAIFTNDTTHLKSLGSLYDTTHEVLMQYLELLTTPSVVTFEDYVEKVLPSLGDLAAKYGISAPMCMQMFRPVLHDILLKSAIVNEQTRMTASEAQEKRLRATLVAKQDSSTTASRVASPGLSTDKDSEKPADTDCTEVKPRLAEDVIMAVDTTPAPVATPKSPWLPELESLFEELKRVIPEKVYNVIGPGFYLTFWQLSSYDLMPPSALYDEVVNGMYKAVAELDREIQLAEEHKDKNYRLRASLPGTRARRSRLHQFIRTLNAEYKDQTTSRASTIKRLAQEKTHWFAHSPGAAVLVETILEHCIIPRCLISPMDADYTAQMIRVIHTSATPGFQTIVCYNIIFGEMPKVILFSCSEFEARNYGRFLRGLLADLNKWHCDENAYEQDNRARVGEKVVHHPGFQNKSGTEHLPWTDFHKVHRKWHQRLVGAFTSCLETGEFMHVYNTLKVLGELLPVFPLAAVASHSGTKLSEALTAFLARETRQDLKTLGKSYSNLLDGNKKLWAAPSPFTNTATSNGPSTNTPPVKPRNAPPTGPSAQTSSANSDRRNNGVPASSTPSGPRAQTSTPAPVNRPPEASRQPEVNRQPEPTGSAVPPTKLTVEGVQRPAVIKRTNRESDDSPKHTSETSRPATGSDRPIPTAPATRDDHLRPPTLSRRGSPMVTDIPPTRGLPRDTPPVPVSLSSVGKEPPKSPRNQRPEDKSKTDVQPVMPPPAVPSQTASAQELRETAKQSSTRLSTKGPKTSLHVPPSTLVSQMALAHHLRNSALLLPLVGLGRETPAPTVAAADIGKERDPRENVRRDSVTHIRPAARDKDGDKERERDRNERGRDRHDRERDRDREPREREKDRDRERDRGGDSRDRHRRGDEKDRERKDRDGNRSGAPSSDSTRTGRAEDNLKRRRDEDDLDRSSKRSSRKEGHRGDDRSRRPEKESHDRDSRDRGRDYEASRRRREHTDEGRGAASSDKNGDTKRGESSSSKAPPSAPAGPRADRNSKPDAGLDRHRDGRDGHGSSPRPAPASAPPAVESASTPSASGGSLRDRISTGPVVSSPLAQSHAEREEEGRVGGLSNAGCQNGMKCPDWMDLSRLGILHLGNVQSLTVVDTMAAREEQEQDLALYGTI
ncbi:hypothetical protein BDZ89DRAFT_1155277 [Hymenopellis radicata]|nr:hypothetical protein BDZ89DRAFT_1155277 [Hymenopellis radicata]